ncbi:MAG: MerR family DNA-binding transcriptional regulator, partial [Aeromonas sp.]
MNISKVASATGLTAKTIRYYESIGLIGAPIRRENGYRSYTEGALRELRFIKRAR